jgi:sugar phosphate isomerase/epimerase
MMIMPTGIVTNCFKSLLDAGESLARLIGQAKDRGYSVIELRQGCLGDGESPDNLVPDPERLEALALACPGIQWDLALGYPCFDPSTNGNDNVFKAGCASIGRLATGAPPHLRLVDLTTDHLQVAPADAAATVGRLLARVRDVDGLLSIEHARESWEWFSEVFARAQHAAGEEGRWLRICFDPCNLLMAPRRPDPVTVVAGLDPETVSMIHIKQRRDGRPWPTVAEGEVDWAAMVEAIVGIGNGRGFDGPLLFEVAPTRDIWKLLEVSRKYLERLGLEMGSQQ